MTAQTATIADFLLARIAEDEEVARAAAKSESIVQWHAESGHPHDVHVSRWNPARVLAECEAKRRIVELHDRAGDAAAEYHERYDSGVEDGLEKAMHALAQPHADHPDFREEWRA